MDDIDSGNRTMDRLREMGVHIHIDDFGTGYSSLSYLHRFPITALKIDRAFVSKLTESGENKEIITSIVSLAKSLNLTVIAEGIELNHQLFQSRTSSASTDRASFSQNPWSRLPSSAGSDRNPLSDRLQHPL